MPLHDCPALPRAQLDHRLPGGDDAQGGRRLAGRGHGQRQEQVLDGGVPQATLVESDRVLQRLETVEDEQPLTLDE